MEGVSALTSHAREHRRRQVKAGMSERELVHVSGGRTVQNRGLAHTL